MTGISHTGDLWARHINLKNRWICCSSKAGEQRFAMTNGVHATHDGWSGRGPSLPVLWGIIQSAVKDTLLWPAAASYGGLHVPNAAPDWDQRGRHHFSHTARTAACFLFIYIFWSYALVLYALIYMVSVIVVLIISLAGSGRPDAISCQQVYFRSAVKGKKWVSIRM